MYMWSSMNTWLRSTASRSRYSGRSWCAIVAIDASSRATCDSSAIVTLSRKRRCTRVLTVRRNQVAVADTPSATAAIRTRRQSPCEHAVAEQLEPEREQRVGQRREQRERERREQQARLVAVAELAQPPHRRQRGRQVVGRPRASPQARTS